MPEDIGTMQKVNKAIGLTGKRCSLSPRLNREHVVAETSRSDTFAFSCAKTPQRRWDPPNLSMAQDSLRSIDQRSYVHMRTSVLVCAFLCTPLLVCLSTDTYVCVQIVVHVLCNVEICLRTSICVLTFVDDIH